MKYILAITTFYLLFSTNSIFAQGSSVKVNPKDSLKLIRSPYFFKDSSRPYMVNPTKWSDFPNHVSSIEMSDIELKKAMEANDFYRVFQISTLEFFLNDTNRLTAFSFAQNYGQTYQDPWMLYYLAQHLNKKPIVGNAYLKTDILANLSYTFALKRKDAMLLRKLAIFQADTSYILNVSAADIENKAKDIEGVVLMNYGQCINSKSQMHEGSLVWGDTVRGLKVYTKSDDLVKTGWQYEGNFMNGYECFLGKLFDEYGVLIYNGQWDKGLYVGNGKIYSPNGVLYQGMFLNGLYHGKGEIFDDNGKLFYSGQFTEGKITGKGKFFYPKGEIYEGDMLNGIKQGKGVYYYADSTKYEGSFTNDIRQGKGKIYNKNKKIVYEGDFLNNIENGVGILYNLIDSTKYEGTFVNGLMNGKMIHTLNGNKKVYEIWKDGKHVSVLNEEVKIDSNSVNNKNSKEKCSAKITTKTYSMEFNGACEKMLIDSQTVVYTYSDSVFVYSFTEYTNAKFKQLKTEEIHALLEKSLVTDSINITKDVVKISNKGGMWYRQVFYNLKNKTSAMAIFVDVAEGKTYRLELINKKGNTLTTEFELFINRFIYIATKK